MVFHWQGFSATAGEMWRAGWELFVEKTTFGTTIIIKNDGCIGRAFLSDRVLQMKDFDYVPVDVFCLMQISKDIRILAKQAPLYNKLDLVDTYSSHLHDVEFLTNKEYSMLCLLKEDDTNSEQIIVDPPTVAELLTQIKNMQAPKAKELLRKENTGIKHVEAKIISIR